MTNLSRLIRKIEIHPLFWLILATGVLTGRFKEVLMVFAIVLVHEMGHVAAAHFFRWRIRKIKLLPFGGVAEMDEHGNRPVKEEVIVVSAGPFQHIWLMGLSYILYIFSIISLETHQLFIMHNLVILGFNLLPVWPLDGGKLIFHLLSYKHSFKKAHQQTIAASAIFVGIATLVTFMILPFHLNLWVILSFIVFSLLVEWKHRKFIHIRFLLERYYGKNQSISTLSPIFVHETEKIIDVMSRFKRGCKHQIILTKSGQQTTYDENELLHAYFSEKRTTCTVGEIFG